MTKQYLESLTESGKSSFEIAKIINKSQATVMYWVKKFGLKLKGNEKWNKWKSLNWELIQIEYDKGLSESLLCKKNGINRGTLQWAAKNNLFKYRSHKKAMELASQLGRLTGGFWGGKERGEARRRMIKRIEEDLNNHPNRKLAGNRNKMTFPEKVVFDYLKSKNVQFEHNKFISPYWVDFCLGKNIIEVDGKRWHDVEKDKIRDANLLKMGFKVFRFDSKEIVKNVSIVDFITGE